MTDKQPSKSSPALAAADLSASADNALAALERAGENAVALVEAWVKAGNAAAVNVASERASGPSRKAARRGLNVLKARGVAIPTTNHVTSVAGEKAPEIEEALMLAPDGGGSVCLVITSRSPTSRAHSVFVYLHDDFGVHRVNVGDLSQSQLKEALARALPGADYRPVKVPVGWARARIAAARQKHAARGVPEPLGFSSARSLLEPVPSEPEEHPFDGEGLELGDEDAQDLAKNSQALHFLPEFRGWFPPKEAIDEMLLKVGERMTPGREPDPEELKKNLEEEVAAATDRFFTPERRDSLARVMKDSALSVLSREGEVRTLEVVATMKNIRDAGLITNPPHEVGFLRAFFDKAISAMAYQDGGRIRIPMPRAPEAASNAGA
ncbi:MAG TPA: hypothetical protein VHM25_10225 [Polyangiaceae bacterium]|jgi:hypothetical protein|nr:hypothetical protein [Polyangiaceae bacterium]